MTSVFDIYNYLDSVAPFSTQEEWDNSGLVIGGNEAVTKAVLCLDAAKDVVRYAADIGRAYYLAPSDYISRFKSC